MGTKFYEQQTERLSRSFKLVYVALRGSGESSGEPTSLDFDVLAADLESVCDELGLEQVAVLGHSILGVLAIEYGRRCPQRVSGIVAVGAPPRGDMQWLAAEQLRFFREDATEERKRLLPPDMTELAPEQALIAQTPMRFYDAHFDAAPLYSHAIARPELIYHLLGSLTRDWDIVEGNATLSVPLLLGHGRYDYIVPYRLWEPVVPLLPSTQFHLFQRSGHQPFFEEPDAFAEVVTAWMKGSA